MFPRELFNNTQRERERERARERESERAREREREIGRKYHEGLISFGLMEKCIEV